MQSWRFILAGSVCTVLACIPHSFEAEQAVVPVLEANPTMATLKLQNVTANTPFTSRSPISAFASSNRPLSGIKICIDPGHGGQYLSKTHYTGGTTGVATGQTESDVNLRVSLILQQYLRAAGAEVIMTRTCDSRCTRDTGKTGELDFRSNLANVNNADLFISVHHNEGPKRDTNYTAVFYPSGKNDSISLAENISSSVSKYLGTMNVGAKAGDYRVLDRVRMPGVIVEASFMSNPSEDQRLAQLSYNKLEAKAIATGIMNYIRLTKGRQVDFNTIFAPIDDQAGTAQMMADASFVRKQIVESRSLFGSRYEEVTYDAAGNVVARRDVGNSSLQAKRNAVASKVKKTATKVTAAAKSTAKKSASATKKVVAKSSSSSKSSSSKSSSSKSSTSSKKSTASSSSSKKSSTTASSSKSSTSSSKKQTVTAKKSSTPQISKPVVSSSKSTSKKSVSVASAKTSTKKASSN